MMALIRHTVCGDNGVLDLTHSKQVPWVSWYEGGGPLGTRYKTEAATDML